MILIPHILREGFLFSLDTASTSHTPPRVQKFAPHDSHTTRYSNTRHSTRHDTQHTTVTTHDTNNTTHTHTHITRQSEHDSRSTTLTSYDIHSSTVTSHDSHSTIAQHTIAQHMTAQHSTRQSQHAAVTHMTAQQTTVAPHKLRHYAGRHLSAPYRPARKLLTGAWLGKSRRSILPADRVKVKVDHFRLTQRRLCRTLWHYAGRHLSAPYGVTRQLLTEA